MIVPCGSKHLVLVRKQQQIDGRTDKTRWWIMGRDETSKIWFMLPSLNYLVFTFLVGLEVFPDRGRSRLASHVILPPSSPTE